jgi:hypothetical protein
MRPLGESKNHGNDSNHTERRNLERPSLQARRRVGRSCSRRQLRLHVLAARAGRRAPRRERHRGRHCTLRDTRCRAHSRWHRFRDRSRHHGSSCAQDIGERLAKALPPTRMGRPPARPRFRSRATPSCSRATNERHITSLREMSLCAGRPGEKSSRTGISFTTKETRSGSSCSLVGPRPSIAAARGRLSRSKWNRSRRTPPGAMRLRMRGPGEAKKLLADAFVLLDGDARTDMFLNPTGKITAQAFANAKDSVGRGCGC